MSIAATVSRIPKIFEEQASLYHGLEALFDAEPGPVEVLLGEPLNIPCVPTAAPSETENIIWQRQLHPSSEWVTIGEPAIYEAYKDLYVLIGTGPKNFTLRIKTVPLQAPTFTCQVGALLSAESEITVFGKGCVFNDLSLFMLTFTHSTWGRESNISPTTFDPNAVPQGCSHCRVN